jgi:hypothetical protein
MRRNGRFMRQLDDAVFHETDHKPRPDIQQGRSVRIEESLELNFYLDAPKALLKVLKHFMSTICSLINSTSKLCRIDERAAKGTFPTLSLEPFDSLIDLLATFRARNF